MEQQNDLQEELQVVYVPIYQKQLGELLKYAKGEKRTMAEFAQACGVSPTTFSRIVNGAIAKPLEKELIVKIAEHADPASCITFEKLMCANGWVPASDDTPRRRRTQNRLEAHHRRHDQIQSILMQELFTRGYTIGPIMGTPFEQLDPTLQKSRFHLNSQIRFGLRVKGFEPEFWHFSANTFTGEEFREPGEYNAQVQQEAFYLLSSHEDTFLRDMWEPEAFANSLYSIVIANRDVFEAFSRLLEGVPFNNSFSLILVDLQQQTVVEERMLPARNSLPLTSLFEVPRQESAYPSEQEQLP
ncbi:MAG: helix-turn-helix domain-containing protein [Oscillospiraceae bacterium]|nr:helix-turn-helix domain-containing protein [Oscillospiraceae bacterium]